MTVLSWVSPGVTPEVRVRELAEMWSWCYPSIIGMAALLAYCAAVVLVVNRMGVSQYKDANS